MFISGEFGNAIIGSTEKSNSEFEQYCKIEGLSSIQVKSDICKIYNKRRIKFLKVLLILVKKII
ncbi:hypothetical protein R0131_17225 [Clostridium sp. AL.422]|uniref:hypothetical protein n=1 Tax=Clostridium TaxID=1485 RepID=UPI00293DDCE7|nr:MULTISPECIES: hypothetical protein [unclassified Clostridium]MDV4152573.1 hypothetical protein [Clostridium sp. AL.422]